MAVTVADAMKIGGLAKGRLLAGVANLDNPIEYIDLIEAPYNASWNTENYLYLTSFYSIKEDIAEQVRTVELLFENNCAGLVFQDYCLEELAPEVIQRAEELGLPLIQVPKLITWAQIIIPLSGAILRAKSFLLERAQATHDRLMDLILRGGGLQEVASVLQSLIECPVAIVDSGGNLLAASNVDQMGDLISDIAPALSRWQKNKLGYVQEQGAWIYPILSGNQQSTVGFIAVKNPSTQIDQLSLVAIEQATTIAALVLVSEKAVLEAERRLKRDFVDDLLGGNYRSTEAIMARAHSLGWNLAHKHLVAIVDLKYFEEYYLANIERGESHFQYIKDRLFEVVNEVVLAQNANSIVVDQSDSVVILPHLEDDDSGRAAKTMENLAKQIRTEVAEQLQALRITIAIGGSYRPIEKLCQSYEEAAAALRVSRQLDLSDGIVWYKDVAVYVILNQFAAAPAAKRWLEQTLGPLLVYDQENDTDLVRTMETYFDANQKVRQAAYRLYIHPKTLSYRLNRIEEILQMDPFKGHRQFSFYLATKLQRLL